MGAYRAMPKMPACGTRLGEAEPTSTDVADAIAVPRLEERHAKEH